MHSIPNSSASWASSTLWSQLASQRSGSMVKAVPPEQLVPKSPSLSALPLNNDGLRDGIEILLMHTPPLRRTHTTPSIRRLKHDVVSDGAIITVIDAAIRAGTNGNGQRRLFIVI